VHECGRRHVYVAGTLNHSEVGMSRSIPLLSLLAVLLGAASASRVHQRRLAPTVPPWCAPDTGLAARLMKASVTRLVSTPDWIPPAGGIHVSAIPAGDVKMLTAEPTCQRVSAALDGSFFSTPRRSRVLLAQAGTYYIAMPVGTHAGEFGILVILDSRFALKGSTTA
jgi:hypothetical protein